MARYVSPVNPAIFATLTLVLLAIGLFFTAWFFVYEVTSTKFTREKPKELLKAETRVVGAIIQPAQAIEKSKEEKRNKLPAPIVEQPIIYQKDTKSPSVKKTLSIPALPEADYMTQCKNSTAVQLLNNTIVCPRDSYHQTTAKCDPSGQAQSLHQVGRSMGTLAR